jgi:hypothetical protein
VSLEAEAACQLAPLVPCPVHQPWRLLLRPCAQQGKLTLTLMFSCRAA